MWQSLLINLLLVSFALAEETVAATQHGNAWKYGTGGGVVGFIILILDIMVFSKFSTYSAKQLLDRYNWSRAHDITSRRAAC